MPSPVLHSAAAVVLVRYLPDAASGRLRRFVLLASLIVAANAPDLDFVPGLLVGDVLRFHHGASHSLLGAALVALASGVLARSLGYGSPMRLGLLLGLALSTHLLLDMLSSFSDERHGVALAWPWLTERVASPIPIFIGIRLDTTASNPLRGLLQLHNLLAVLWEVLVVCAIWGFAHMTGAKARSANAAERSPVR